MRIHIGAFTPTKAIGEQLAPMDLIAKADVARSNEQYGTLMKPNLPAFFQKILSFVRTMLKHVDTSHTMEILMLLTWLY